MVIGRRPLQLSFKICQPALDSSSTLGCTVPGKKDEVRDRLINGSMASSCPTGRVHLYSRYPEFDTHLWDQPCMPDAMQAHNALLHQQLQFLRQLRGQKRKATHSYVLPITLARSVAPYCPKSNSCTNPGQSSLGVRALGSHLRW